jgi:hypothetical protein
MHTFTSSDGYTFHYNSDLSGHVEVSYKSWEKAPVRQVYVSGRALKEFVAESIRNERIAVLEQMTTEELLR